MARRCRFFKSSYKADLRKATKAFLISPAQSRCQSCGYNVWCGNLTFHHKDETTKKFNISEKLLTYSIRTLIREASKCIIICHNCHGEVHAGLRSVADISTTSYRTLKVPNDLIVWYKSQKSVLEQHSTPKPWLLVGT